MTDVRILGSLEVANLGEVVTFCRPQQRALVAALALRANEVVPAERLIEDLWGDQPPRQAGATVRAHVSHLRRTLGAARCAERLVTRRPGYMLRLEPEELDAWRFERLTALARQQLARGEPSTAAATLSAALAEWRGPALADFAYAPFAEAETRRLEEARLAATEDLVDARLAEGQHHTLVGELRSLVTLHPLRERLWGQLMLALARAGRQAEALRAYAELRQILADELGLEPSPSLTRLESEILCHEGGTSWEAMGAVHLESPTADGPTWPLAPAPISSFVGRDRELAEVRSLVRGERLVTLAGPGGCGKTRLALAVAAASEGLVAFVDLASVADPALVVGAVAGALGVREDPARPMADVLAAALASQRALLVLDNCEHVIDAVAALAERLLRSSPGMRVLATSRRRLGTTGEVVWTVPPMALPDAGPEAGGQWWNCEAVRLFAERAAGVDPGFIVDVDNAEAVVALCRHLDGLPLAIELAAARTSILSVHEIVARLVEPFRLLAATSPAVPARHRTLRGAVEWSYGSLAPDEQRLFARLSVFRGGFDVEAAEAVAGTSPCEAAAVLDGVAELVASSLVARVRPGRDKARFRILETLRAYAVERLEDHGESTTMARRHARWCAGVAGTAGRLLRGAGQDRGLAVLDREEDNLRAALDWALVGQDCNLAFELASSLWWYWFRRGRICEGRDRLRRVLSIDALGDEQRAAAMALGSYLAYIASDEREAAVLSREAVAIAERLGGPHPPAVALDVAGLVALAAGDTGRAEASLQLARAAFRAADDVWGEAWVLRHLSGTHFRRGLVHAAAALAEQSRVRFAELGDEWGVTGSIDALASIARAQGDVDLAGRLGQESIQRHRAMGEHAGLAIALHHQAELLVDEGDLDGAAELARESVALDRCHGAEGELAATAALLAEIDRRRARSAGTLT